MDIEKLVVGFFRFFWYFCPILITHKTLYKLRRTWNKIAKVAWIKSSHLQPDHHLLLSHVWNAPDMPNTSDTSDSDTNTLFPPDADVSPFGGSGIGWLKTDASQPTLSSVNCWLISELISWETDTRFYRHALMGERSVKFFIRLLPGRSINGDAYAYQQTQIDGDRYK